MGLDVYDLPWYDQRYHRALVLDDAVQHKVVMGDSSSMAYVDVRCVDHTNRDAQRVQIRNTKALDVDRVQDGNSGRESVLDANQILCNQATNESHGNLEKTYHSYTN